MAEGPLPRPTIGGRKTYNLPTMAAFATTTITISDWGNIMPTMLQIIDSSSGHSLFVANYWVTGGALSIQVFHANNASRGQGNILIIWLQI